MNATRYAFYYKRNLELDKPRKELAAIHWPASEISYDKDSEHYASFLNSSKRQDLDMVTFVNNILCLFQQLDGLVVENLFENFVHELSEYKEIRDFFIVQENNELVHAQSYGDQMFACIKNTNKIEEMIQADISKYPAVNKIIEWSLKWMDPQIPIVERLIAFAAIEGIIFTAAFVAIYRLKEFNIFPGICKANEFISRDEALHTRAGIAFFKHICKDRGITVSNERFQEIIESSTNLACEFAKDAVQPELIGLKLYDLECYMRLTANKLCEEFEYPVIYNNSNAYCAFDWMNKICLFNISNFFETRPSEYKTVETESEGLTGEITDDF
jgi:ribonucleoside-diphosphate reductase subunit M2